MSCGSQLKLEVQFNVKLAVCWRYSCFDSFHRFMGKELGWFLLIFSEPRCQPSCFVMEAGLSLAAEVCFMR